MNRISHPLFSTFLFLATRTIVPAATPILLPSPATPSAITTASPDSVWQLLKKSNARFAKNPKMSMKRVQLVEAQKPIAIILSCSDSRVPPELIFRQTLGSLFVVRTAGHAVDNIVIDTIEYAVSHFSPSVIVVLGHSNCGAVVGALKHLNNNNGSIDVPCKHLCAVLIPIEKTIVQEKIDRNAPNALTLAIRANVRSAADRLMADSSTIKDAVKNKTLMIVGAEYSLQTGEVTELFTITRP